MKNLYLLPTDKPSRLLKFANQLIFDKETEVKDKRNQHIYITSDEKIKEGDWTINTKGANEIYKVASFNGGVPLDKNGNGSLFTKKIILTTDEDLIKNGVQAIDDKFLEWFIKNPNCEGVEIDENVLTYKCRGCGGYYDIMSFDHIGCLECYRANDYKTRGLSGIPDKKKFTIIIPKEESKQETLEEAARQWGNVHRTGYLGFIDGAQWQAERMYSEEDMIKFHNWAFQKKTELKNQTRQQKELLIEWLKQFKNK